LKSLCYNNNYIIKRDKKMVHTINRNELCANPSVVDRARWERNVAENRFIDYRRDVVCVQKWLAIANERGVINAKDLENRIQNRIMNEAILSKARAKLGKEKSKKIKTMMGSYITSYKMGKATYKVIDQEKVVRHDINNIEIAELILEHCNERIKKNRRDLATALANKEDAYTAMRLAQDKLENVKASAYHVYI
jgi:hypothetical protein